MHWLIYGGSSYTFSVAFLCRGDLMMIYTYINFAFQAQYTECHIYTIDVILQPLCKIRQLWEELVVSFLRIYQVSNEHYKGQF